jgi:outer membrane protein assembly factor BamB
MQLRFDALSLSARIKQTSTGIACLLAGLMVHIGPARGDEGWPQWRGERGDSIVLEKGIARTWGPESNVVWRTPLPGQGGATPIIIGDRILLTSADGDDLVLMCLALADGRPLWSRVVTDGNQDARAGEGNSASPSPSTDGEHVWVFFSTGVLAAYTLDGDEVWKFDVGERFGKLDIQFGMTSTPVLDGDSLYLQLIHGRMKMDDDSRIGKVIRLNKLTGQTIWEVDRLTDAIFENKHSYASPFIYRDSDREFLVVHGADCTTGHSLEDGTELWRLGALNGPSIYNRNQLDPTLRFVSSPSLADGWIIVPTAKGGPTVAIQVSDALAGDVTGNEQVVRWVNERTPDVALPLIVDGLVYNLHNDGRLQCLDLETGEQIYFQRTHTSQHRSSPVYIDGHIYLCARDGRCTVVKAGREFEIVASNDLDEAITASPIVHQGRLYLRTYDALYAIAE